MGSANTGPRVLGVAGIGDEMTQEIVAALARAELNSTQVGP